MSSLRAIFGAARERHIDEDNLRSIARQITGSTSLKNHTPATYRAIIDAMGPSPNRTERLDGPHVAKLRALWIAAYNLAVVRNSSDQALTAFVKRNVGIDHMNWLIDAQDASRVIEAIKAMINRDHDIDWTYRFSNWPWMQDDRFKVAEAIFKRLVKLGAFEVQEGRTVYDEFVQYGIRFSGKVGYQQFKPADWIPLQNDLGKRLRAAVSKQEKIKQGGDK